MTFLTSADHKAALDAFAAQNGLSVGHVLRESSSRYIAQEQEDEAQLAMMVEEVNRAIPKMHAALDHMIDTLDATHAEVDRTLRTAGIRK